MREHALPQDVTGYKFHIIGNMTLKQFGEVAAGCIVGFLLYQTNLYPMIKIPLIILAAGSGALIAFVPIEERPLDQWITAFFRALYRPTQYYWKRMVKIPEPFLYEPRVELKTVVADVDLTPARRQRVKDYLRSIDEKQAPLDQLETYTEQRLNEVMGVFGQPLQTPQLETTTAPEQTESPDTTDILNASPENVSDTVDSLSFTGRAMTEEPVIEQGPSAEEVEMSNNVLRLFDTNEAVAPEPEVIPPPPQFEPPAEVLPEPAPEVESPKLDSIPDKVDVSVPEQVPVEAPEPTPPPEPVSEPEPPPEPFPEPKPLPQPEPVTELKPPKPTVLPEVSLEQKQENSVQLPEKAEAVPEDLTSIPEVALEPDETNTEEPTAETELPQISTVFDGGSGSASAESLPSVSVDTSTKYSLSAHGSPNADSSEVAQIADVIAKNAGNPVGTAGKFRSRGKNSVQFKTRRNDPSSEAVLPHILDMTGSSDSVIMKPKETPPPPKETPQSKEVLVPELEEIRVERTVEAAENTQDKSDDKKEMSTAVDPSLLQMPEKESPVQGSVAVTFNANLPFPEKPTVANKVVGMVIDQAGNSLPNTIVEILTPQGVPARAVKTNPLGQFFIATPLNPGDYLITAEKEGLTFDTHQLPVTNKIIDPIEIRAN